MNSPAMLTVYGRRSSFNVQKVMWLVGELGLAHRHVDLGGSFGGLDDPAFLAKNPHGRVPVIEDEGLAVWESHAILRYLAARYGGPQYWPEAPADRAEADGWMDWTQTTLQPDFLVGVFWGYYRTPEAERDMARVEAKIERCAAHFLKLDSLLAERPYLSGEDLGLADIPAGTHLYRYFNLEIAQPDLPHVTRWYERLSDRPAYREHVMIPFADLYGRLDY